MTAPIDATPAQPPQTPAAHGRPSADQPAEQQTARAWEERYQSRTRAWSGNPNAVLVTEVGELAPGTALEAGCGEGADAVWLALRGWQVTAADFAPTALRRGAEAAARVGVTVQWEERDLARQPASGTFDLVTSFFPHMPVELRARLFRHLAAAVKPGGTLLIVGHDPSDNQTTVPRPGLDEMGWTAHEIAAGLGSEWTIEIAHARPRTATDPDGRQVTVHDAVLRARRSHAQ